MPSPSTERVQPRCTATTLRGTPCQAFAAGGAFCHVHDPARAEQVQAARAKGGQAAGRLRRLEGRRAKLDTAPRLLAFASNIVHDLAEHRLDSDTGRAVLYGVGIMRQLVEAADLEPRMAALEQRLATKGARKWG